MEMGSIRASSLPLTNVSFPSPPPSSRFEAQNRAKSWLYFVVVTFGDAPVAGPPPPLFSLAHCP